jgi:Flp pilus assembly protein TadG
MLIIGIIESGWIFAQYLDVRHGAREGARIAAVNYPEGSDPPASVRTTLNRDALVAETCARMNVASSPMVIFTSAGGHEDAIEVTTEAQADTLSGLLDWAFPSSLTVSSTVVLHAEQEATWANTDPLGQAC